MDPSITASLDLSSSRLAEDDVPLIEGYRLEQRLGEGSFGCVWAGLRESSGQKVAVKVITRGAGINWKYFQHELSMLREVAEHPHIVTLIDANLEGDSAFLVMPILGGSLSERIWPGDANSLERSLRWFEQIARALAYTHRKGILHCDLKPSNVLIDEEDQARVVDFGQARSSLDGQHALGTIGYMPPEQIERHPLCGDQPGGPDVSWDIYALGATMYYLLTRTCPRLSDDDRQSIREVGQPLERLALCCHLQRTNPLVPLRQLNSLVDEDLARIVESCLDLDPGRRPLTEQVLDDLERRRRGHPLLCQRPWGWRYRLDRFVKRPLVAASLLIPFLFLLFINTFLTVKSIDSLHKEAFRRLSDVNRLARQMIQSDLPRDEVARMLSSKEFRHYVVASDGQVRTSYNDPSPPTRLDINLGLSHYGREAAGEEILGVTGGLPGSTLVSETSADQALPAVADLRLRNAMLTFLIVLVTALLAVLAFRFTGGDG